MNTSNPDERVRPLNFGPSPKVRPLDMAKVAVALGAEPAKRTDSGTTVAPANPLTRMLTGIAHHRQVSGAALKIDVTEQEAVLLAQLADEMATEEWAPSPKEVGRVLWSLLVEAMRQSRQSSTTATLVPTPEELARKVREATPETSAAT